jgi:hypothetical protein
MVGVGSDEPVLLTAMRTVACSSRIRQRRWPRFVADLHTGLPGGEGVG